MPKNKTHITKLQVSLLWSQTEKVPVGTLFQTTAGTILFEYSKDFLAQNIAISPFKLPNIPGTILAQTDGPPFYSLFGVFADSLPDGWGLLLMARAFRKLGFAFAECSTLDKLAFIGRHGMGAIIYEPVIENKIETDFFVDLVSISTESQRIIEGQAEDLLPELLILGGSPGGARPKIAAAIEKGKIKGDYFQGKIISGHQGILPEQYEHWLIKFRGMEDNPDSTLTEYLYCKTAEKVGLELEPTALFKDAKKQIWFGMRRFDRLPSNKRVHLHSLAGLLHANFRIPSLDYEAVLKATLLLTRSVIEVEKAFRLAIFNAVFHNRDDHAKNFSFLMDKKGDWKLAPAYDLTFSNGPGGEHTTAYKGEGKNPCLKEFISLAKSIGIHEKRAKEITLEVEAGKEFLVERMKELKIKNIPSFLGKN